MEGLAQESHQPSTLQPSRLSHSAFRIPRNYGFVFDMYRTWINIQRIALTVRKAAVIRTSPSHPYFSRPYSTAIVERWKVSPLPVKRGNGIDWSILLPSYSMIRIPEGSILPHMISPNTSDPEYQRRFGYRQGR